MIRDGAENPVPVPVIVHDTADAGAEVCQDPLLYGDGHETTGAAGVTAAIRSSRAGDHGPYAFDASLARTRSQ